MLHRSTIQLLRLHFSLFLLPVYVFAISQLPAMDRGRALLVFVILHFLVYPSSNGYNSYMDRDETPIGGLRKPLQPTRQLFRVSVAMDIAAVVLSLLVSIPFTVGILFYIIASRAYSFRRIRLKQYPVIGFLTVFVFQGAVIFYCTYHGCHESQTLYVPMLPCFIASLLIGALYPLTQIYQHQEDKADGVTTISYLLGKRGTFVFSALIFLLANICLYLFFRAKNEVGNFILFLVLTAPVVLFFLYWMIKVWQDESAANFKNSLRMNIVATLCILIFFTTLTFTR